MKHVLDVTEPCQNDIDMEFLKTIDKPNWKGKKLNKMNKFVQVVRHFGEWGNSEQTMNFKRVQSIFGEDDTREFFTYFIRVKGYIKPTKNRKGRSSSYKLNSKGLDFYENVAKKAGTPLITRDNRAENYCYSVKIEKDAIQYIETDNPIVKGLYEDMDTGELHFRFAKDPIGDFLPRTYATVQNMSRELRREVFKGWFDIDVVSCAYSVLEQDMLNREEILTPYGSILDWRWFNPAGLDDIEIGILKTYIKQIRLNILFASNTDRHSEKQIRASIGSKYPIAYKSIIALYEAHPGLCMHLVNGEEYSAMLKLIRKIKKYYKNEFSYQKYQIPHYKAFMDLEYSIGSIIRLMHSDDIGKPLVNFINMHDGFIVKDPFSIDEYQAKIEEMLGLRIKFTMEQF